MSMQLTARVERLERRMDDLETQRREIMDLLSEVHRRLDAHTETATGPREVTA